MTPEGIVKRGIEFRPEEYRQATVEHAAAAGSLYEDARYVLCIYVSGLAVECMFRAYHAPFSNEFDARHDLNEWARKSKFNVQVPRKVEVELKYSVALSTLTLYWSNKHRYRSQASLGAFFKRSGAGRSIRGNALKEIARRSCNAALDLVSMGGAMWS